MQTALAFAAPPPDDPTAQLRRRAHEYEREATACRLRASTLRRKGDRERADDMADRADRLDRRAQRFTRLADLPRPDAPTP